MPGKTGNKKKTNEEKLQDEYESLLQELFQFKKEGVVLLSEIQKKIDKLKKEKVLKIIDKNS